MLKEQPGFTPKQEAKLEASREKNDIKLMREGATVDEEAGRLEVSGNQRMDARREMEADLEAQTLKKHMGWVKRHAERLGATVGLTSIASVAGLMLAGESDHLPEAFNDMPVEAMYALLFGLTGTAIAGAVLTKVGSVMGGKWKQQALERASVVSKAASEEDAMKLKVRALGHRRTSPAS